MQRWLDIASAICALVAAAFWFLSAYGQFPPMVAYWDRAPESDPFYVAIKFSAEMNKWAAGLSGLSALLMAIKLFIQAGP